MAQDQIKHFFVLFDTLLRNDCLPLRVMIEKATAQQFFHC
jgi:hypothetical protein